MKGIITRKDFIKRSLAGIASVKLFSHDLKPAEFPLAKGRKVGETGLYVSPVG